MRELLKALLTGEPDGLAVTCDGHDSGTAILGLSALSDAEWVEGSTRHPSPLEGFDSPGELVSPGDCTAGSGGHWPEL